MLVYDILLVKDVDASFEDNRYLVGTVFDVGMAMMMVKLLSDIYEMKFELEEREIDKSPSTSLTLVDEST